MILGAFVSCSYVSPLVGVAMPLIYYASSRLVSFPLPEGISMHLVNILVMVSPNSLPVCHEEGLGSVVYRPDMVACQFGFDQCVSGLAPPLLSFSENYGRLSDIAGFESGRRFHSLFQKILAEEH